MILANLSVRRPVLMTMVIMAFVVLGLFSYFRLVVDLFPDVDFPIVTVTTVYPGAGPEEIEIQVSKKIEDAVSTLSNVKRIDSISQENVSNVTIEFNIGTNVDLAAIDVKDEVDKIRRDLPEGAEDPLVVKFNINAQPIMDLAISGARSLQEVYDLADNLIRDELAKVDGVASIEIVGGREREIQVKLDREKLKAYNLSVLDVQRAIATENLTLPAGHITEPWLEYTIRTKGEFQSVEDLAHMQIHLSDTGGVVELQELGQVLDTFKEVRDLARFNGKNAVGMTIQKRSDANTVRTAAGIKESLEKLKDRLPPDVDVGFARDRSLFIESSVDDAIQNIFLGIFLTAILLYLFLHTWRGTLVAAIAMPTSIVATCLLIDFAGFTINVMSLMALGVSIGVLVTNSLVVLENISRHIEEGEPPEAAAELGTDEIAVAVIASTATNIVVFTPIAFMSGIIGQFFLQFGLTVVFATIFSLIISFTLTPMLSAKLLRREHAKEGRGSPLRRFAVAWDGAYQSLAQDYRLMLGWSLNHPIKTSGIIAVVFAFSFYLFSYIGGEFIPASDQGLIVINMEMPPGTPLEETNRALLHVETLVNKLPETETVFSTIGGERRGVEDASVLIQLVNRAQREKSVKQIINELRPRLVDIPGADIQIALPSTGGQQQSDIVIEVTGPEMETLRKVSEQVRDIAAGIDGLVDVETSYKPARPEFVFTPDRRKMADLKIPTATVASVLRTSFEGSEASIYREQGEEYDIRVKLADHNSRYVTDVDLIVIKNKDYQIPLNHLGRLEIQSGTSEVLRKNKIRLIKVSANVGKGSQTEMIARIQAQTDQLNLLPGYLIYFGGQEEDRKESFAQIIQALFLAMILTYMVLAAILESFVHPFTIMLTLPLGLIGVAFSLFLAAKTINIFSMMAMVMLVGIVVNNAILILDYAQTLRQQGMGIKEALLEAAPTRLRPIVMANLAIALGMMPQALGGTGSEFRVAMAVVTIGGVLLSAIFTLFIIPVVYVFMDRFAKQRDIKG